MNAKDYIQRRQLLWAYRRGIELGPGSHKPRQNPQHTRVVRCEDNFFEPITQRTQQEYEAGDGGELACDGFAPKIHSVWSSSALAVNVFSYWRERGDLSPVAECCGIPASGIRSMHFEVKLPIGEAINRDNFPKDPNIDVVFRYHPETSMRIVGVECKFTETYSTRRHNGMRRAYLDNAAIWKSLPACYELAKKLGKDDRDAPHLHRAQLLKHILGLKHEAGDNRRFRLVYLWYDVPFGEGSDHRREIEAFAEEVRRDKIEFQAITYQELIAALARQHRTEHRPYIDYLAERYL